MRLSKWGLSSSSHCHQEGHSTWLNGSLPTK